MKKINHPNIVKLFEVIEDKLTEKIYLVMEYMKKGSLLSIGYYK
jgi:[calcium/calmodulin-dependent protein kinase] kinase